MVSILTGEWEEDEEEKQGLIFPPFGSLAESWFQQFWVFSTVEEADSNYWLQKLPWQGPLYDQCLSLFRLP